ncbi:MAG: T9SS type A sorting domain-containing protein [Bacteroidota bacterium]
MEKKLLSIFFIFSLFFLNPFSGFGQCPTSVGVTANPGTTICAGEEITFTANPTGGSGYKYQWQINQTNINGETFSTFKTASLTNGQKVRVIVTSSTEGYESCDTKSSEVPITVNPIRTVTATIAASNTNICPGEAVNFTISSQTNIGSGSSYEWKVNGTSQGTSNTFSSSTLGTGDKVQLWVDSSVPCTEPILSNIIDITEKPGTPATPSDFTTSETELCPGVTQTYTIPNDPDASEYIWTLPSGWAGSSTTNSITLTSGNSGSGTITVKAKNSCGTSEARSLAVSVKAGTPAIPGTISGTAQVCPGISQTFSISTVTGATSYAWTFPTGWTGSSTSTSITLTPTAGTAIIGNLSVTAINDCGISSERTLAISVKPGTPAQPSAFTSGPASLCPGTNETYSVPTVEGATQYIWILPTGFSASSLTTTTPSLVVTAGNSGSGNITVKATNDCGTGTERSMAISINPPKPVMTGEITGSTGVCASTTSLSYSIPAITNASSYEWTVTGTGWQITSGAGTNQITVSSGTSGGTISVIAKNSCGDSASKSITVNLNPPPPVMAGEISGPSNVCAGSTGNTYSIPAITGATSYTWTAPSGWSIPPGQNSNTITVNAGSSTGNISVTAINGCGSSTTKNFAVTTTAGVPAQPNNITSSTLGNNLNICPPQEGIRFSVPAVPNATGYNWTPPPGWEITSGANTREIVVKVNAAQTYVSPTSISVSATNICGSSTLRVLEGIGIDSFILTNAGTDRTLCKSVSPITVNAEVSFGNNNFKPTLKASGRNNDVGFSGVPNNVKGTFTYTYTPIQADLDRGFVVITLSVPKPTGSNSSCGSGVDEMTITFRETPTATITTSQPICNGTSTALNVTGTPNTKVTYKKGSGSNLTVNLNSSGTGIIESGNLTENTTFQLVSIEYLDSPTCLVNLPASANAVVTVTQKPTATISYNEPYCSNTAGNQAVTLSGTNSYTGGNYSSTTGLSINSTTGAIIPSSSTPGTYTVTYTIPATGGCEAVTATTDVTITPLPTATISYGNSPFCSSDNADKLVDLAGTNANTGGTYSSTSGLNINASSGIIKPSSSEPGTYTVTYTLPAASGCEIVTSTTEVTVTEIPIPNISYTQEAICNEDSNTFSPTIGGSGLVNGGTFSAPSGLNITSSGVINPLASTPGTYKVIYTLAPANGCGEVTAETEVTITAVPSVEISYAGPFCESTTGSKQVAFTNGIGAYENGSFTSSPSGLTIDATTGAITPSGSEPGEYIITYTIPESGGCESKTAETTVNITAVPKATLVYNDAPFCTDSELSYEVTFTNTEGNFENGTFSGTTGLVIDATTGAINPDGSTSGSHTVTYTIPTAEGCDAVTTTVDITVYREVSINSQPFNIGTCTGEGVEFEVSAAGDGISYQWFKGTYPGSAISGATSNIYNINTVASQDDGIYYVEVSGTAPCEPVRSDEVTLNVDENIIVAVSPQDEDVCLNDDVTLYAEATANGGAVTYQWRFNGNDLTGENNAELKLTNIQANEAGEYSVFIEGPSGFTCSSIETSAAILSVYEPPTVEAGNNFEICSTETSISIGDDATASNHSSLVWTSNGEGQLNNVTDLSNASYSPISADFGKTLTFTLTAILEVGGGQLCAEALDTKEITIIPQPVITAFSYTELAADTATEFCETDTAPKTTIIIEGNNLANGTGIFSVDKPELLSINSSTGAFTPNGTSPGVYIITYTFIANSTTNVCTEVSRDFTVTIGAKPVPDFEYDNTEYCTNSTDPILSYNNGGVAGNFTATPAGLSLNSANGAIDLSASTPNTYTITNTITAANGCQQEMATYELTINPLPIASISYSAPTYCETDASSYNVTVSGSNYGGGTYSISPATGLTMNASGQISPNGATVGDYTITYTIPASGGCELVVATTEVEISPKPVGEFEYASTEYCSNATDPSPQFINGGVAGIFTGTAGLSITSNGTIDLSASTPGSHTVTNTIASTGGCTPVIETFNIYFEEYVAGGAPLIGYAEDGFGERFTPVGEETNQILACHNGIGEIYLPAGFDASNVVRWESSTNLGVSWTSLGNGGSSSLSFTGLSGLTSYRAVLDADPNSNACGPVYSLYAFVSVIPASLKPNPVSVSNTEFCMGDSSTFSSTIDAGGDDLNVNGGFQEGQLNADDPDSWLIDGVVRGWSASGSSTKKNQWSGQTGNQQPYTIKGNDYAFNSGSPKFGITVGNLNYTGGAAQVPYPVIIDNELVTTIETPKFSLLSFQDATFEFDEAYVLTGPSSCNGQSYPAARAVLEISTNGGSSYSVIPDNLVTAPHRSGGGAVESGPPAYSDPLNISGNNRTNFGNGNTHVSIDLSPYFGQTNIRIRLKMVRNCESAWAVDNFALPGNDGAAQVQWTDQFGNTLNPISGTNNIIYTPETPGNQTFTVTSFINGCRSLAPEGSEDVQLEVHNANGGFDVIVDQSECGSSAKLHAYDNSKTPLQNYIDFNNAGLWDANAPVFTIIDNDPMPNGNGVWDVASTDDINKHGRELLNSNGNGTGKFIYSVTTLDNSNGVLPAGTYRDYGPTNANQYWSIVSGPSGLSINWATVDPADYFSDVNDAQADFFGPGGNYVLRWTVEGNNGIECFDNVAVTLSNCTTLDFDGEDDVVVIENAFTGVKAFEAWIRPEVGGGTIISGPSLEITTPTGIEYNGRWYHLAVIYDDGGIVPTTEGLYIDGIKKGEVPTGNGGGTRTSIGAKWTSADVEATNYFSGWIEEVRIWKNSPTLKEIRFMMNQRLKLNGTAVDSKVVTPLEGEVVPNRTIAGSYYIADGNNLDKDGDAFYNQTAADLYAYYRLISDVPDPTLNVIPNTYKPVDGNTPDLSLNDNPGRLYNMTTHQENTSPTPYFSNDSKNGQNWEIDDTWARTTVWDPPNSDNIEWNIARINSDIQSGDKDITMLGLLSETAGKQLTIEADHPIRISHYLLLNGNMDLVGESQLLQDHGSILNDASKGWLERDQQGTQSSFNYNYWSSPVSIQGKPNNSGYTVGEVLGNPKGDIEYVNDPFAADATPLNPSNVIISSYWLWTYYPADVNVYANWEEIWETGTVSTGGGFTMKGTSGAAEHMKDAQNYAFKGKPHNGDITLTIGKDQNYLIGNPYPSAIDGRQFILDNLKAGVVAGATNTSNVFDGAIYFWDHFVKTNHILKDYEGGYAVLNLIAGVPAVSDDWRIQMTGKESKKAPKRFIPVGQAFLINSADYTSESDKYDGIDGGDINFKNSQRVFKRDNDEGEAIFLKPEIVVKEGKNKNQEEKETLIRLSFKSPIGMYRQILVGAVPNTTNGFDLGYDALLLDNNREDMYWIQGNNYLVIQGVPDFNKEQVLPLGVKIDEEKEFSIQIDTVENSPSDFKIYLKDNLNDTVHNLTKKAYTSTSKIGYIHDRFEIIFYKEEPLPPVVEIPWEVDENDEIYKEFGISVRHGRTDRELQILNPHELDITNMYFFDLNGNKLEGHKNLSTEKEFRMPVRNYSSGIYIVQLVVEGRVVSKKIIINN